MMTLLPLFAIVVACLLTSLCYLIPESPPQTHAVAVPEVLPGEVVRYPFTHVDTGLVILAAPRVCARREIGLARPEMGYASDWDRLVNDLLGRQSVDQEQRIAVYPSGTALRLAA
jgi:hypothetical protein